jgi:hypothetical protein
MTKIYRQGAVGALLDEYERAILDLQKIIEDISDQELTIVIDTTYILKLKGYNINRPGKSFHSTIKEYTQDLLDAWAYTTTVFKNIKDTELEQFDNSKKLLTAWGQVYDIEQMTEHAIVHTLRHRRQIEKFKIALHEQK